MVSRGYGSRAPRYPFDVSPDTNVIECGDELMLLAQNTRCPVVIDADRVAAAQFLPKHHARPDHYDDGMQHYALARDLEIAVIDGSRGHCNSLCLLAGPLREPPSRLQEVDFILVNGEGFVPVQPHYRMSIVPGQLQQNLVSKSSLPGNALATKL
ncbi:MAG: tetraacyldisaccharide 4'-kinase [Pseudomonadales bacterium]